MNNNGNKKKIYFFIILAVYLVLRTIFNILFNSQNILNKINIENNHCSVNTIVLISTIISFCILFVILIIARFISIVYCKVVYKNNDYKQKLDDIYYVSLSFKIIWLVVGIFLEMNSISNAAVLINMGAIISYILWEFIMKGKVNKELLIQLIFGTFLIIFV